MKEQDKKDYQIIDVRTAQEYAEGHIPQAMNIPNEIIQSPDFQGLGDKHQKLMVYCRSGKRSRQAAQKLAQLGYTNVVDMGSILAWEGKLEK